MQQSTVFNSIATQAQTQAIGMIQVISKSKIIRTFRHCRKLFRREAIWTQCFHWPNTTTCGKYSCACVMLERYFVFTCLQTYAKHKKKKKKKILVLALALSLCLCLRQGRFQGEIRIIVFALELASLVKTCRLNK